MVPAHRTFLQGLSESERKSLLAHAEASAERGSSNRVSRTNNGSRSDLEQARHLVNEERERKQQLEAQVASLQATLRDQTIQLDELRNERDAMRQHRLRHDDRGTRLASQLAALEQENASLSAKLLAANNERSQLQSRLDTMQMRILELQQGYISMAACDDGVGSRDLIRRGKIGGLMRDAAAAGVLDADLLLPSGAGPERLQQNKAAGATIAALTRERDALQQRLHELSGRLAESVSREAAARGAQALRSASWKRSAVQAEARLAAALKRVKELSEDLRKRDGEARQRDRYTAQLERTVMAQHKTLQQQRRLLEMGKRAAGAAAPGGREAAPASTAGDGAGAHDGFGPGAPLGGHAGGASPRSAGASPRARPVRPELHGNELAGMPQVQGRNMAPGSPSRYGPQLHQQQRPGHQHPPYQGRQQQDVGPAVMRRSADGAGRPWGGSRPGSPSRMGPGRPAVRAASSAGPRSGGWVDGESADLQFEEPYMPDEEAPGDGFRSSSPPPAVLHQQLTSVEASLEQLYRELEEFKDYSVQQRAGGRDSPGGSPPASSPRSPPTLGHLASPAHHHGQSRGGWDGGVQQQAGDVHGRCNDQGEYGHESFAFPPSPSLRAPWSPPGSPGSVGHRGRAREAHGSRPQTAADPKALLSRAASPGGSVRYSVEGSMRGRAAEQHSGDSSARSGRARDRLGSPRGYSDSGGSQPRRLGGAAGLSMTGTVERRPVSAAPRGPPSSSLGSQAAASGPRHPTDSGSPRSVRQRPPQLRAPGAAAGVDRLVLPPSSPARSVEARRNGGGAGSSSTTANTAHVGNDSDGRVASCACGGDPAACNCGSGGSSGGGGGDPRRGGAGRGGGRGGGPPASAREVSPGTRQLGPRRPVAPAAGAATGTCDDGAEDQPRQPLPTHMLGHLLRCAHHGHGHGHARVSPRGGGGGGGGRSGGRGSGGGIHVHRPRAVRPAATPGQRLVSAAAAAHGISLSPRSGGAAQPEQYPEAAAASPDFAEARGRSMRGAAAPVAAIHRGRLGERQQPDKGRGGRAAPASRSRSPVGTATAATTPRGSAQGYAARSPAAASPAASGRGVERDGSRAASAGPRGGPGPAALSAWADDAPRAAVVRPASPGSLGAGAAGARSSPPGGSASPTASPCAERRRYALPPSPNSFSPISALLANLTVSPRRPPQATAAQAQSQSQPYLEYDDVSSYTDQRSLSGPHGRPRSGYVEAPGEPTRPSSSASGSAVGGVKRRPHDADADGADDRRKTRGSSGGGSGSSGAFGSSRGETSARGGASDGSAGGSGSGSNRNGPHGGGGGVAAAPAAPSYSFRPARVRPGEDWTGTQAAAADGGGGHVSYTFDGAHADAAAWRPPVGRIHSTQRGQHAPGADAGPPSPRSRAHAPPMPTASAPGAGTGSDSIGTSASKGLYGRPTLAGWLGDTGMRPGGGGGKEPNSVSTTAAAPRPPMGPAEAEGGGGGSPPHRARPMGDGGGSPVAAAAAFAATALQRLRDKRMQRMQNSYQAQYLNRFHDVQSPLLRRPPSSGAASLAHGRLTSDAASCLTGDAVSEDDAGVVVLALRGSLQGEVIVSPRLVPSAPTSRPSSPGGSHHQPRSRGEGDGALHPRSASGTESGAGSGSEHVTMRLEVGGGGAGDWRAAVAAAIGAAGAASTGARAAGGQSGQQQQPHPHAASERNLRALREEMRAGASVQAPPGAEPRPEPSRGGFAGASSAAPAAVGVGGAAAASAASAGGRAAGGEAWTRDGSYVAGGGEQWTGSVGGSQLRVGTVAAATTTAAVQQAQPQPHPLMQLLGQASEDLQLLSDRLKPLVDGRPAGVRS